MKLPHALQSAAATGLLALGLLGWSATPALAYTRTQCDDDGDYCWRISCNYYYGGDCHPIDGSGYYRNGYYRRYHNYSGRYYGGGGYYGGYDSNRRYACDRDGDDCRWTNTNRYDDDDE
jgi:hypothetical protein